MNASRDENLHLRALALVRAAYDVADSMRNVDLAALNEPRPPTLRYHAHYELVMEFINRAGAMLDFAGKLDLIDSDEELAILRDLGTDHAELFYWLESEDKRLSSEP